MRESDLEQLYARLEKPLYNVVYRWVWNADESQEVVQEAFVRLWRMRERVEMSTVEPLVYRIALNLAASRLRNRKIWKWVSLDALRSRSSTSHVERRIVEDERRAAVREALTRLPDDLRQVVVLCELSGLSYAEIGAVLSIPVGTVGSKRHRALKMLRGFLDREGKASDRRARGVV